MATESIGEVTDLFTIRNTSDEAMIKFALILRRVADGLQNGSLRYLSGGMAVHSEEMGQIVLNGRIDFIEVSK